jgi:hypothetical protein
MKTLPSLWVIASVALVATDMKGAQGTSTHPGAGAAIAAAATQPPTSIAQLEARIEAMEQELESLRKNGTFAGQPVAHVQRLPKTKGGKSDGPEALQVQINRLWDQMDLILRKLDELADKR